MFVSSAEQYRKEIISIASESEELCMAVAFWGRGAEKLLSGREGRPTRVICNLKSGATNPDVIAAVKKIKGVQIRQHDSLHAKVVVGSNRALVGSANFSCNGLNLEGGETEGWVEAGLMTSDVKPVQGWFDALWKSAIHNDINDDDIEEARELWEIRRGTRPLRPRDGRNGFSLAAFTYYSLLDRPVYLVVYRDRNLTDEAVDAYRQDEVERTGRPSKHMRPTFEGWPELPKGSQLIDCYQKRNGTLTCYGVLKRVYDVEFRYSDRSPGHLAVCDSEKTLLGLPFKKAERDLFVERVQPYIEAIWDSAVGDEDGKYIPLADVWAICEETGTDGA